MLTIFRPPFQVRTAGLIQQQPYHSTPGTRENDIMLTVFLAGRGIYENSKGRQYISSNMAGLVPPEDRGILIADSKHPYTHYYCRFNGSYAEQLAYEIIAERGRFFSIDDVEKIADLMRQMGTFFRTELPERMGLVEAMLAQILVRLIRRSGKRHSTFNQAVLEQYLRDHLAEPTDLDRMADHFQRSKANLCRLARKLTGQTIVQFSESMKIEWAKILLRAGTFNITEVARRVGYADPFYFSRVFKKHTGLSPKKWAKQLDAAEESVFS